ncbi:MAG: RNA-binding cell elongation regulator Jag/EloR [Oscillospiraceae bacterium]
MIKEVIKSGATIDDAKMTALLELGITEYDDFKIEVLKTPSKKLLGLFGGSLAEVKISIEVPDEVKKPAYTEKKVERSAQPVPQKKAEKTPPVKKEFSQKPVMTKEEKKDSLKETKDYDKTAQYIKSMVLSLGMEKCEVKTFADDEEVSFELECGDDYGIVIGRRGETLDAIQYLARMMANKGSNAYKRVSINIGNYREKREQALTALARKNAIHAVKSGRSVTLEPMNPYERRLIHTAVQEIRGATSFSTGLDLDRRVVIAPENGSKPPYNKTNNYTKRENTTKREFPPKREPYVPAVPAEPRAPKSDVDDGGFRYGKIEVKKD